MAELAMHPNFDLIERRLGISRSWYGDHWSIVDAYINWVWFRVTGTQFDGSAYPILRRHDAQMKELPAVVTTE
jgi:glutathione S-transferase